MTLAVVTQGVSATRSSPIGRTPSPPVRSAPRPSGAPSSTSAREPARRGRYTSYKGAKNVGAFSPSLAREQLRPCSGAGTHSSAGPARGGPSTPRVGHHQPGDVCGGPSPIGAQHSDGPPAQHRARVLASRLGQLWPVSAGVYGAHGPPDYPDYSCRSRRDVLRAARGDRCTARLAPARTLDALV
jgi:hypothetical protein